MKDPNVIYPEGFDVAEAWNGCLDWVDQHGEGSLAAAFGADPGCCHCPVCRADYWAWGQVIKCECGFVFPTNWWASYSEGCNDGAKFRVSGEQSWLMKERQRDPYYREGFNSQSPDPAWESKDKVDWASVAVASVDDFLRPSHHACKRCGVTKEEGRQNSPTKLCIKCETETECRHRCSMMKECCKAGVVFEKLRERRQEGESLPCYWVEGMKPMNCASFDPVTAKESAEDDEEIQRTIARFMTAGAVIAEVKKEHKGRNWTGTKDCPVCGGKLHMSHAACNGHVHGRCETDDCLAWME
ncbi:MAG: hypothetical protein CMK32_08195 [Porticoccaceae bacterium]|nr:hypothetical protein [Porticoccaceae bacterium]